jgi:hypothetical protein
MAARHGAWRSCRRTTQRLVHTLPSRPRIRVADTQCARLGWRWAFLAQMPLFAVSIVLTSWNLRYVTPVSALISKVQYYLNSSLQGKGQTTKEILKRIDYAGSITLMGAVCEFSFTALSILSLSLGPLCIGLPCEPLQPRISCEHFWPFILLWRGLTYIQWASTGVIAPLVLVFVMSISFVYIELQWAVEPVMAPWLLRHKISVLVSLSNFLVANCNFAIQYFYPMWFQTVLLRSASDAGRASDTSHRFILQSMS